MFIHLEGSGVMFIYLGGRWGGNLKLNGLSLKPAKSKHRQPWTWICFMLLSVFSGTVHFCFSRGNSELKIRSTPGGGVTASIGAGQFIFEIQIHKYEYTNANIQTQLHKYTKTQMRKYTNTKKLKIRSAPGGGASIGSGQFLFQMSARQDLSHKRYNWNTFTYLIKVQKLKYKGTSGKSTIW